MTKFDYEASLENGIRRAEGWVAMPTVPGAIENLTLGKGSRKGSLSSLSTFAQAHCVLAFFRDGDVDAGKNWAAVAAKLQILRALEMPEEMYLVEDLVWPLLSDNEDLISWYARFDLPYKVAGVDVSNARSAYFYRFQSFLALNGDWDQLAVRSEEILEISESIKKDRAYLIDHEFYLALARSDEMEMTHVLQRKNEPKRRRIRYEQQSGIARDVMDTYSTVFAKMAWRKGAKIAPMTPWVSERVLPVKALSEYSYPWPFLAEFDIWGHGRRSGHQQRWLPC